MTRRCLFCGTSQPVPEMLPDDVPASELVRRGHPGQAMHGLIYLAECALEAGVVDPRRSVPGEGTGLATAHGGPLTGPTVEPEDARESASVGDVDSGGVGEEAEMSEWPRIDGHSAARWGWSASSVPLQGLLLEDRPLAAIGPTAPHLCDVPDCPGPKLVARLEAGEKLAGWVQDVKESVFAGESKLTGRLQKDRKAEEVWTKLAVLVACTSPDGSTELGQVEYLQERERAAEATIAELCQTIKGLEEERDREVRHHQDTLGSLRKVNATLQADKAEVARLQADLEEAQQRRLETVAMCDGLMAENAALRARVEKLEEGSNTKADPPITNYTDKPAEPATAQTTTTSSQPAHSSSAGNLEEEQEGPGRPGREPGAPATTASSQQRPSSFSAGNEKELREEAEGAREASPPAATRVTAATVVAMLGRRLRAAWLEEIYCETLERYRLGYLHGAAVEANNAFQAAKELMNMGEERVNKGPLQIQEELVQEAVARERKRLLSWVVRPLVGELENILNVLRKEPWSAVHRPPRPGLADEAWRILQRAKDELEKESE